MAYRWYICPVVTVEITDGDGTIDRVRAPKVYSHIEPGRGKRYQHSSAIDVGDWSASIVKATDWTPIDADSQCVNVLGRTFDAIDDLLNATPRQLGVTQNQFNSILTRLANRGVDTTGLTRDSTFETILDRLCQAVAPYFRARRTRL